MSAGRHTVAVMVFWQLTIDANDPALLVRFWAPLGDPEREGWAMHVAVTPERHEAELDPRHYCPAHAMGR